MYRRSQKTIDDNSSSHSLGRCLLLTFILLIFSSLTHKLFHFIALFSPVILFLSFSHFSSFLFTLERSRTLKVGGKEISPSVKPPNTR